MSLAYQVFTFYQKGIFNYRFATLFNHPQRLIRCLSSVVNHVGLTALSLTSFLHRC